MKEKQAKKPKQVKKAAPVKKEGKKNAKRK